MRKFSLEQFLELHRPGLFKEFLDNCLPENQGWHDGDEEYDTIEELLDMCDAPYEWIERAFLWDYEDRDEVLWANLSEQWKQILSELPESCKILLHSTADMDPYVDCSFCEGTGKNKFNLFSDNNAKQCQVCEGTGKIKSIIPETL